ncbi:MAG: DUF1549 domain-containing protein, partial [Opitutaceae bacterium]|nr:DUF1549 domain-containing protein [Opitutaceae bacterium]
MAALLLCSAAAAADSAGLAFFEQKIRPVLAEHCYECHSERATKLKGGLLLDTKAGWQKGGDSGEPALIPGKPDASLLLRVVRHLEDDLAMPPKKPQLPAAIIADLAAWIAMGAPDPRDGAPVAARRADKSWWSLQPIATRFAHETIDGFVAEKLAAQKLAFNSPADPRTLIRRMTYDLHGLPPTADE